MCLPTTLVDTTPLVNLSENELSLSVSLKEVRIEVVNDLDLAESDGAADSDTTGDAAAGSAAAGGTIVTADCDTANSDAANSDVVAVHA